MKRFLLYVKNKLWIRRRRDKMFFTKPDVPISDPSPSPPELTTLSSITSTETVRMNNSVVAAAASSSLITTVAGEEDNADIDNDASASPGLDSHIAPPRHPATSAMYSNFYLKLPNGKYLVRVRTADRQILGSYTIEADMI